MDTSIKDGDNGFQRYNINNFDFVSNALYCEAPCCMFKFVLDKVLILTCVNININILFFCIALHAYRGS